MLSNATLAEIELIMFTPGLAIFYLAKRVTNYATHMTNPENRDVRAGRAVLDVTPPIW
jgi:hypothetical protein